MRGLVLVQIIFKHYPTLPILALSSPFLHKRNDDLKAIDKTYRRTLCDCQGWCEKHREVTKKKLFHYFF